MSLLSSKLNKYIPKYCYMTIFDIDYNALYASGKRIILFDLDNTIASYDIHEADDITLELFENLKSIGFEIIIISNNYKKRVKRFLEKTDIKHIARAFKPLKNGYRKAINMYPNISKDEIIAIGDQLLTDVLGANRFGIDVILVRAIRKKTEKWFTILNRKNEKRIISKIKDYDAKKYDEIMQLYEDNNGK